MHALHNLVMKGAKDSNPSDGQRCTSQVHSRPEDQERVKRKMEATAELAVDLVKEMIEEHVSNNTKPSKDDIAIMEHTHSDAIRVFNLGAGAKNLTPLEEPRNEPKGFAGLKVFGAKKPKPPDSPSGSGSGSGMAVQGGGSSE